MTTEDILVANAVDVWKGVFERAEKLFNSLSEEEMEKRVAPDRNRSIYIWGHLTATHDRAIALLGVGERLRPEFDAIFLNSADGMTQLPTVREIRDAWKQVSDRLNAAIVGLSAADWLEKHTAVNQEDFAKEPLRNKLAILLTRTNHLSYHLGQMVLVRS